MQHIATLQGSVGVYNTTIGIQAGGMRGATATEIMQYFGQNAHNSVKDT